jgi:hypothetical protein
MHCLESGYFLPPLLLLLLLLAAATQTTSPTAANREEMPAESHPGNPLKKPTTHKSLSLSLSLSLCVCLCGHNQATAKCQQQVIRNLEALKTQLRDSFRKLLLPTSLLRKLQETYEAVEQWQYNTHKNSQAISKNSYRNQKNKFSPKKKKTLHKSTSSSSSSSTSDKSLLNQAGN